MYFAVTVIRSDSCHANSLAATNRVTEQFNWLTVKVSLCLVQ